jgi:hypothetical protein
MNGQAYANATRCAQVIFQKGAASAGYAGAGSAAQVIHGFLDCLGGFARNLGDLPHQVGAERKHHVCQTRDVAQEGVAVFLNEAAIA